MSTTSRRPMTRSRASQPQPEVPIQPPQKPITAAAPIMSANAPAKTRREVYRIDKTPSFSETFGGRLEWKKRHYDKPVTSTPLANSKTPAQKRVGAQDLEQIISPIPKTIPTPSISLEVEKIANRPNVSPPQPTVDSQPLRVPLTPLKSTAENIVQIQLPPEPQEKVRNDEKPIHKETRVKAKAKQPPPKNTTENILQIQGPTEPQEKVGNGEKPARKENREKAKAKQPPTKKTNENVAQTQGSPEPQEKAANNEKLIRKENRGRVKAKQPQPPAPVHDTIELLDSSLETPGSPEQTEEDNVVDNPNFSHFLELYGEIDDNVNLRVDRSKIKKTYSRKSDEVFDQERAAKKVKLVTKTKPKRKSKSLSGKNSKAQQPAPAKKAKANPEKIDRAAMDWMEATNKEFANIMNFPLCVEKLE